MQDLHRTLSLHLEVWGSIDDPAAFLDLVHSLAASDIGQSHGGFTSDADLVDSVRKAFLGSEILDLYGPRCHGRMIVEQLMPGLVASGLSVRARFWTTIVAGYRFEMADALTHVVVMEPSHQTERFILSGSSVLQSIDRVENEYLSGNMLEYLAAVRQVATGRDHFLDLSAKMIEWLGVAEPAVAIAPGR